MSSIVKQGVAQLDPFSVDAIGAGLCVDYSPPTFKASGFIRTDSTFGSDGTFMLVCNPAVANDAGCIWYSSGGSNNTTITNSGVSACVNASTPNSGAVAQGLSAVQLLTTNQNLAVCKNLPYGTSDLLGIAGNTLGEWSPPNIRARIVGAGVKVKFAGTTLADGGTFYALVDPVHENLSGQTLSSYLLGMADTQRSTTVNREEIMLTFNPKAYEQTLMSGSYDSVGITRNSGGGWSQGYFYTWQPSNNTTATNLGYPQAGTGQFGNFANCLITDPLQAGRAASQLIYPMSRRNQKVVPISQIYSTGTTPAYATMLYSGSIGTNGVITWGSLVPPTNASGLKMAFIDPGDANYDPIVITYDQVQTLWYANFPDGTPFLPTSVQNFSSGQLCGHWTEPTCLGAIMINAGSAMAGQPIHIEYFVHVEYSGLGVQGRDSQNQAASAASAVLNTIISGAKRAASAHVGGHSRHLLRHFHKFCHILDRHVPGAGHAISSLAHSLGQQVKAGVAQGLRAAIVAA